MKIELWCIGKTKEKYLIQGISIYEKRLRHYCKFSLAIIPEVKSAMSPHIIKQREWQSVEKRLSSDDFLVLLDEKGEMMPSVDFSQKIEKWMLQSPRRIIFLVAGAFGAADEMKRRSDFQLSLSKMTFSHQMVRLFFVEQLYRAFTIIRHEKYHNL